MDRPGAKSGVLVGISAGKESDYGVSHLQFRVLCRRTETHYVNITTLPQTQKLKTNLMTASIKEYHLHIDITLVILNISSTTLYQ